MPKAQPASSAISRAGRRRRVATSLSEINVVPLVDVMLVLLIIFMVTAPMIQRGIDVNLPVARRAHRGHRAAGLSTDAHAVSRERAHSRGRPAGARASENGNGHAEGRLPA